MANKVFENTGRRIIAYSDDSRWKFVAIRRSTKKEIKGRTFYVGSYWTIEFSMKQDGQFKPTAYPLYKERLDKKQDVIELFKDSQEFSQAYKELKS